MIRPVPSSSPAGRMPCSTCRRDLTTASTRSLKVTGAMPGGPDRHFCRPADTASSSQASVSRGIPATDAVAST